MHKVEQLKREYTDKYVKVVANYPELARFRDVVGQVKTVNMSGRALVEFLDYHLNIGWYDIDLSCLTVVPKPTDEEREAAKKVAEKPAGKAAPTTGAKQTADAAKPAVAGTKAGGGAAKPAAAGGAKMSVADMLAAARGGGAAPATPAAPKAKTADAAKKPAAPKPAAPPKPAGKMSVADMLAAARAKDSGGEAATAETPADEAPAEEVAAPAPAAPVAKAKPAGDGGIVKVDRTTMSVADMIAYCREHDAA